MTFKECDCDKLQFYPTMTELHQGFQGCKQKS